MKLRRLQKALCCKYVPVPNLLLEGLYDQCRSLLTTFRSRKPPPHIAPALPGVWQPLTWRLFCYHQFACSLWNQSAGWSADLSLIRQWEQLIRNKASTPQILLFFMLLSWVVYCAHYRSHIFCQPQLHSWRPKEENCSILGTVRVQVK